MKNGSKSRTATDNAMWRDTRTDKEAGIVVGAHIGNDFTNGHRGEAKSKRGAKKFLNSRIRAKQKEYLLSLAP
jgi:hypothetical protein